MVQHNKWRRNKGRAHKRVWSHSGEACDLRAVPDAVVGGARLDAVCPFPPLVVEVTGPWILTECALARSRGPSRAGNGLESKPKLDQTISN